MVTEVELQQSLLIHQLTNTLLKLENPEAENLLQLMKRQRNWLLFQNQLTKRQQIIYLGHRLLCQPVIPEELIIQLLEQEPTIQLKIQTAKLQPTILLVNHQELQENPSFKLAIQHKITTLVMEELCMSEITSQIQVVQVKRSQLIIVGQ